MSEQHTATTVGFIGIGAMGLPMATRLHNAGYDVTCVDASPARREQAEALGMSATAAVDELANREVIVVMVATADQVASLLETRIVDAESDVRTIIVCSTVGPLAMRKFAEKLAERGKSAIDLAVTGGVEGAAAGTLTLFAAGDAELVDGVSHLLSTMGRVKNSGTRPGDGQSVKLVNNLLTSVNLVTVAEAMRLATSLGLDRAEVLDLISDGAAASWMLKDRGPRMAQPLEDRALNTFTTIFAKDTALIEEVASESGTEVPLLRVAKGLFAEAIDRGWAERDDSCIVDLD